MKAVGEIPEVDRDFGMLRAHARFCVCDDGAIVFHSFRVTPCGVKDVREAVTGRDGVGMRLAGRGFDNGERAPREGLGVCRAITLVKEPHESLKIEHESPVVVAKAGIIDGECPAGGRSGIVRAAQRDQHIRERAEIVRDIRMIVAERSLVYRERAAQQWLGFGGFFLREELGLLPQCRGDLRMLFSESGFGNGQHPAG
ncbi:MAG: hypothetical protein ABI318_22300, partial [Chthoniobacteraceae bacterium]